VSQALTGTNNAQLDTFCASSCLPALSAAFTQVGNCMQGYKGTLVAALTKDGVANATQMATLLLAGYQETSEIFQLMCTKNEAGAYCLPTFYRMATDMASAASSPNITSICNMYFNLGCCLTALDNFYSQVSPGFSFVSTMAPVCPILQNFNPPPCLVYGGAAAALVLTFPLYGLNCADYATLTPDQQTQIQVALRDDLANAGLSIDVTSVKTIATVNGVCTATVVIRAATDALTNALKTQAQSIGSASLTATTQAAAAMPSLTTAASITTGNATVAQVTLRGQTVGSSGGSSVLPSFLVLTLAMWAMF